MTALSSKLPPWRPDAVFGFKDGEDQAKSLAASLGVSHETVEVHYFPDSECRVRIKGRAKRPLVFRSLHYPNAKLVELVLAASILREDGATDMALVAPYLPYMRQDIAFRPGEAVSQKVIGNLLAGIFDRFASVEPHLHRTKDLSTVFKGKPALELTAAPAIATHLKDREVPARALILGPDEESTNMVRAIAEPLKLAWTVATKQRHGDRDVSIALPPQLDLHNRPVIIVDDVISSGGTIVTVARLLREAGCRTIDVYTTHALFDVSVQNAIAGAGARRIYSGDGIEHPSNGFSLTQVLLNGLKTWAVPS